MGGGQDKPLLAVLSSFPASRPDLDGEPKAGPRAPVDIAGPGFGMPGDQEVGFLQIAGIGLLALLLELFPGHPGDPFHAPG